MVAREIWPFVFTLLVYLGWCRIMWFRSYRYSWSIADMVLRTNKNKTPNTKTWDKLKKSHEKVKFCIRWLAFIGVEDCVSWITGIPNNFKWSSCLHVGTGSVAADYKSLEYCARVCGVDILERKLVGCLMVLYLLSMLLSLYFFLETIVIAWLH